jgi:hypothetical protein
MNYTYLEQTKSLPSNKMNTLLTKRIATIGLLFILFLIVIFHFLVMLQVIPPGIVWGGRVQNSSQMLALETVSITVNLMMLGIVSIDAGYLKVKINRVIIKISLWTMFVLFLSNTFGNLLSINELEKIIFTPLTFLLSIFSLRLAMNKEQKPAC